jgi:hypothetical protein
MINRALALRVWVLLKIPKNSLRYFPVSRGLFERSLYGVSPADSREVEESIRSSILSQYGDFMLLLSAKVMNKCVDRLNMYLTLPLLVLFQKERYC